MLGRTWYRCAADGLTEGAFMPTLHRRSILYPEAKEARPFHFVPVIEGDLESFIGLPSRQPFGITTTAGCRSLPDYTSGSSSRLFLSVPDGRWVALRTVMFVMAKRSAWNGRPMTAVQGRLCYHRQK